MTLPRPRGTAAFREVRVMDWALANVPSRGGAPDDEEAGKPGCGPNQPAGKHI